MSALPAPSALRSLLGNATGPADAVGVALDLVDDALRRRLGPVSTPLRLGGSAVSYRHLLILALLDEHLSAPAGAGSLPPLAPFGDLAATGPVPGETDPHLSSHPPAGSDLTAGGAFFSQERSKR